MEADSTGVLFLFPIADMLFSIVAMKLDVEGRSKKCSKGSKIVGIVILKQKAPILSNPRLSVREPCNVEYVQRLGNFPDP